MRHGGQFAIGVTDAGFDLPLVNNNKHYRIVYTLIWMFCKTNSVNCYPAAFKQEMINLCDQSVHHFPHLPPVFLEPVMLPEL
jgi:hypothetical protein